MDINISLKELYQKPWVCLALGLGSGLAKKAPGTFGSLAALPFCFLLALLPAWLYLIVLVATFLVGIVICDKGCKALGVHDHPAIVWDEFVGVWLTFFLIPLSWLSIVVGFALFRFFDILKPWPVGWADKKVPGGLGIMLDDIFAGIYACAILHGLLYWGLL